MPPAVFHPALSPPLPLLSSLPSSPLLFSRPRLFLLADVEDAPGALGEGVKKMLALPPKPKCDAKYGWLDGVAFENLRHLVRALPVASFLFSTFFSDRLDRSPFFSSPGAGRAASFFWWG